MVKIPTDSVTAGFLTIFGHIYIWCDSNFDGRHSNFFCAIIHLFLHPSLKQISPRITQESTTTHMERSIKNPWVTHRCALDTRGQLITYLNSMQAAQHQTHGFGVRTPAGFCVTLIAASGSPSHSTIQKLL